MFDILYNALNLETPTFKTTVNYVTNINIKFVCNDFI
jgi:hypothetical protein